MEIIPREELEASKFLDTVFIYPTDTIYGIGCDATNRRLVDKARKIKNREAKPFSIIAPSKQWIFDNCHIPEYAGEWLDKLPGAHTLIFRLKNKNAIAENVAFGETIGVRIPFHWIATKVAEIGVPVVTTSVNLAGEPFMTSLDNLDPVIERRVDFAVPEGVLNATPSRVVDLTGDEAKVLR